MPRSLQPIPSGVQITEKDGTITTFFRLAWQALVDGFGTTPLAGYVTTPAAGQSGALPTTIAQTVTAAGMYRVNYYARVLVPDGVSSSLAVVISWVDGGATLTATSPTITGDSISSLGSGGQFLHVDALTDITVATTYASHTPGAMKYRLDVGVEQCL